MIPFFFSFLFFAWEKRKITRASLVRLIFLISQLWYGPENPLQKVGPLIHVFTCAHYMYEKKKKTEKVGGSCNRMSWRPSWSKWENIDKLNTLVQLAFSNDKDDNNCSWEALFIYLISTIQAWKVQHVMFNIFFLQDNPFFLEDGSQKHLQADSWIAHKLILNSSSDAIWGGLFHACLMCIFSLHEDRSRPQM